MSNVYEEFRQKCLDKSVLTFQICVGGFMYFFAKVPCGSGCIVYSDYVRKDQSAEAEFANKEAIEQLALITSEDKVLFLHEHMLNCWERETGSSPKNIVYAFSEELSREEKRLHEELTIPFWDSLEPGLIPEESEFDLRSFAFRREFGRSRKDCGLQVFNLDCRDYRLSVLGLLNLESKHKERLEEDRDYLRNRKSYHEAIQKAIREHSYMSAKEFSIAEAVTGISAKTVTVKFFGSSLEYKITLDGLMHRLERGDNFWRYDLADKKKDDISMYSTRDIEKITFSRKTLYQA